MFLCPLCNGLTRVFLTCPRCGQTLEDTGILENYFEPYSPYLGEEILDQADGVGNCGCVHLFHCPKCNYDQRYTIKHTSV